MGKHYSQLSMDERNQIPLFVKIDVTALKPLLLSLLAYQAPG